MNTCSFNYLHAQNTQKERNQHQNHSHIDIKVKQNCIISACPTMLKFFVRKKRQIRFTGAFEKFHKKCLENKENILFKTESYDSSVEDCLMLFTRP